ncbi:kinesin family protein [Niveomyces insectorum RCEF 264]|uniref:Kinesin family protein n=1 Tax=Niveomyces insectorum RCEF 264 TaxID=1081102 RepID=A0A167QCL2_9HYPO|nr:kinesin family protein [Niveomyces insectorum RCEF 264]
MEPSIASASASAAAPVSGLTPFPSIAAAVASATSAAPDAAATSSLLPTSPTSPGSLPQRPMSVMVRPAPRSNSRMSVGSKTGGSRASDEDGRTSVKVAVRVRPPLRPTDPGFDLIPQRFQRSMVQVTSNTSLAIDSPQGRKLFVFDRVFGPEVNQEGVWDYLTDCVNAFTTGYNVSLLAYGQSGAGKSYTMGTSGPTEQEDLEIMGVIPRAAIALFEKLEGRKPNSNRNSMSHLRAPKGYSQSVPKAEKTWSLKATYVEIYNEQLRDLLISENVPSHERPAVTIREDVKGNILLTGLHQVEINSVEDLLNALNFGSTLRQTDATAINARSSRSHAVFSLNLVQRKSGFQSTKAEKRMSVPLEAMTGTESWVTIDSKLHFVDLAGSERLKNTGAQGERAKEGISINAGLAALGKVISQLSSRQPGSHVSYRDSRLTRLLQDSLGGNAITYMIACVTPPEFHLSETLNTVQYAQRARAIQSKPRIQQVEEGDKQAIIDRLKAEVAFLREQIRSAASSGGTNERRILSASERSERQGEREVDLQNALLDVQENYSALSQRHARLIAEMAKARDNELAENEQVVDGGGDSATERLNRSSSFAHAVEQVVLEYEKTIQSLEQSLSSTRATLSNTETNLLEKETKCAYAETINTQLQARLQKLMDREANTENYLHDLEAKLDGHTSGEEKNATIIIELRKEIARIRENEATCEDYISTLEERLAEADQDAELMQREIDRLEQVVERQRSLGKLDSLLYELDNMQQQDGTVAVGAPGSIDGSDAITNGSGMGHRRTASRSIAEHSRSLSHVSRHSHSTEVIPEEEDGAFDDEAEDPFEHDKVEEKNGVNEAVLEEAEEDANNHALEPVSDEADVTEHSVTPRPSQAPLHAAARSVSRNGDYHGSPAQSRFVADKLENVTQELLDLRVEHESTINEFDLLHAKYEEALRTLAELQDAVDEARHPRNTVRDSLVSAADTAQTRPSSFLSDSRASSELKDGRHYSSSRSLSSELSSALESPATMEHSDAETLAPTKKELPNGTPEPVPVSAVKEPQSEQGSPAQPSEVLSERPRDDSAAIDNQHADGVLEAELERLRTLASQKEAAEKELSQKYAELEQQHHQTLDMVEELKTEVAKAQQAAEVTSPRSSTPVIRRKSSQNVMIIDRAHRSFASLRNIAAENFESNPDVMQNFELNLNAAMHELHARSERIQELEAGVASARKEMETKMAIISGLTRERSSLKGPPVDISVVSTLRDQLEKNERQLTELQEAHAARERELEAELESLRTALGESAKSPPAPNAAERDEQIRKLEAELSSWESKHQAALSSMGDTEKQMKDQIDQLESQLEAVNAQLSEARRAPSVREDGATADPANVEVQQQQQQQQKQQEEQLQMLRNEVDEYKAIISSNAAKLAEFEAGHLAVKSELEEAIKARDLAAEEAKTHQALVSQLEETIANHEKALTAHHENLDTLHANHAKELEELKSSMRKGYDDEVQILMAEHAENVRLLESDLTEAREDLMKAATQVAFALGLDVSVEKITERIEDLIADQKALTVEQRKNLELQETVTELSSISDSVMRDLEAVRSILTAMLGPDAEQLRKPGATVADQMAVVQKRLAELENRNKKNSRLVDELEEQLQTNFDQAQLTTNRLSTLQTERNQQLEEANAARIRIQSELDTIKEEYANLQARYESAASGDGPQRSNSMTSQLRKSSSVASLPSPPPVIPLPPLPNTSGSPPPTANVPSTPTNMRPPSKDIALQQIQQDQEARIRTIEKHLDAEKQLTQTLEEALTDLEDQSKKMKADCDAWRRRCTDLEAEIKDLKERPVKDSRWSLHQVEEERKKRRDAEIARAHLEERMNAISKKKKKGSLNCF